MHMFMSMHSNSNLWQNNLEVQLLTLQTVKMVAVATTLNNSQKEIWFHLLTFLENTGFHFM